MLLAACTSGAATCLSNSGFVCDFGVREGLEGISALAALDDVILGRIAGLFPPYGTRSSAASFTGCDFTLSAFVGVCKIERIIMVNSATLMEHSESAAARRERREREKQTGRCPRRNERAIQVI